MKRMIDSEKLKTALKLESVRINNNDYIMHMSLNELFEIIDKLGDDQNKHGDKADEKTNL